MPTLSLNARTLCTLVGLLTAKRESNACDSEIGLRAPAMVELVHHQGEIVTRECLTRDRGIPAKFLESILAELTHTGTLTARREVKGDYLFGKLTKEISVKDVIRAGDYLLAVFVDNGLRSLITRSPVPVCAMCGWLPRASLMTASESYNNGTFRLK